MPKKRQDRRTKRFEADINAKCKSPSSFVTNTIPTNSHLAASTPEQYRSRELAQTFLFVDLPETECNPGTGIKE